MKVESIVFDCPLLFRGSVDDIHTQRIIAPSMEHYLWNNEVFKTNKDSNKYYDHVFLITVEVNDTLFVIQKSRKLKKLQKVADNLSVVLDANIVIVKVTHLDEDGAKMEPVYVADHLTEDDIPEE